MPLHAEAGGGEWGGGISAGVAGSQPVKMADILLLYGSEALEMEVGRRGLGGEGRGDVTGASS